MLYPPLSLTASLLSRSHILSFFLNLFGKIRAALSPLNNSNCEEGHNICRNLEFLFTFFLLVLSF